MAATFFKEAKTQTLYIHLAVTFCATASLIVYYALGGRARSVAPSDRIGPGAFARLRHSIPALKGEMVCSQAARIDQ
jgi:hypothetical protein